MSLTHLYSASRLKSRTGKLLWELERVTSEAGRGGELNCRASARRVALEGRFEFCHGSCRTRAGWKRRLRHAALMPGQRLSAAVVDRSRPVGGLPKTGAGKKRMSGPARGIGRKSGSTRRATRLGTLRKWQELNPVKTGCGNLFPPPARVWVALGRFRLAGQFEVMVVDLLLPSEAGV